MNNESANSISKNSKSSFYYAFSLLPKAKRNAMNIVYAFCRKTDDIVDEGNEPPAIKERLLTQWRVELEKSFRNESQYPLLNKVSETVKQFNIPVDLLFELIKGMEMDIEHKRFKNFEELRLYCFRAASTVGLMCIEIFGYKHESARLFAENLGIALQLTNILRDISKDAQNGRIYLPMDELAAFNYSEDDLLNSRYNANFIALMEFQAKRAKEYFDLATSQLNREDKASMFAARAMQHIYYRNLERIVQKKYDVFNNYIKVSKFEKVGISLGVWAKYNIVY